MSPQPRLQVIGDGPVPRRGVTPPSGDNGDRLLGDVIVDLGFASRKAVDLAAEAARTPGRKLGAHLLEEREISEDQLARALAERHGLDHVDLTAYEVDLRATRLINPALAARHQAVPIAYDDAEESTIVIATTDPTDWLATDEITAATGLAVRPAVVTPGDIAAFIARLPELGREGEIRSRGGEAAPPGASPAESATGHRTDAGDGGTASAGAPAVPPEAPASRAPAAGLELDAVRRELAAAYGRVAAREEELAATRRELSTTQRELAEARVELASARGGSYGR